MDIRHLLRKQTGSAAAEPLPLVLMPEVPGGERKAQARESRPLNESARYHTATWNQHNIMSEGKPPLSLRTLFK